MEKHEFLLALDALSRGNNTFKSTEAKLGISDPAAVDKLTGLAHKIAMLADKYPLRTYAFAEEAWEIYLVAYVEKSVKLGDGSFDETRDKLVSTM